MRCGLSATGTDDEALIGMSFLHALAVSGSLEHFETNGLKHFLALQEHRLDFVRRR